MTLPDQRQVERTPEAWIYVGHCQGCGEIVEAVLGDYPDEIAQMAKDGLIVIRRAEPLTAGRQCFCPTEPA